MSVSLGQRGPPGVSRDHDMQTVVHVTHEAIQKIGGIGAVLHGLLTSQRLPRRRPRATSSSARSGPATSAASSASARRARCSTPASTHLYRSPLAARFREIEQTYDVGIVYGRRKFVGQGDRRHQHAGGPADRRQPLRRGEDRRVQVRAVEEVRHRQRQVRAHLGLRAVHAPGPAGHRGAARAGRGQQRRAVRDPVARVHGHAHRAGGDPGGRPGQLPHDLLRPRGRDHAPHRRGPPRPRHDVLQRHARRDGRRGITSRTSSATRAATTSTRW